MTAPKLQRDNGTSTWNKYIVFEREIVPESCKIAAIQAAISNITQIHLRNLSDFKFSIDIPNFIKGIANVNSPVKAIKYKREAFSMKIPVRLHSPKTHMPVHKEKSPSQKKEMAALS